MTVSTHSVHIDNSDIRSHHATGRVFTLFFFLIYSPTPTPSPYPSPLLLSRFRATVLGEEQQSHLFHSFAYVPGNLEILRSDELDCL